MNTRVLLVDDEVAVRRQLRESMTQSGFEVAESGDVLDALRLIERGAREGRPFGVVVTDMVLPDIGGFKLLSIIKSRYPDLKVVVTSGHAGEETPEEVQRARADGFLARPFSADDLASMLAKLLGTASAEAARVPSFVSSYVFFAVAGDADPMEVYQALAKEDAVYCDAVRGGEHQILILVHGATHEEIDARVSELVRRVPGIDATEIVRLRTPHVSDEISAFILDYHREHEEDEFFHRTPNRTAVYVRLDVSPGDVAGLYERLYFVDGVVELDASVEGDQLILLLQAADFERIHRVVNQRIRLMEGIRRIRELKVIPFQS